MNQAKVTDLNYINFLVGSPVAFSCTEAARVQPHGPRRAAMTPSPVCSIVLTPTLLRSGMKHSSMSSSTTVS